MLGKRSPLQCQHAPRFSRFLTCILTTCVLITFPPTPSNPHRPKAQRPRQPPSPTLPPRTRPIAFWDRTNILLFSGVAVFRGLDYASTRNFQARGREEILIPDDVVNNSAGFASLEAAGTARVRRPFLLDAPHQPPQDRTLDLDRPHRRHRLRRGQKLFVEIEALGPGRMMGQVLDRTIAQNADCTNTGLYCLAIAVAVGDRPCPGSLALRSPLPACDSRSASDSSLAAESNPDRFQFNHDIHIEPNDKSRRRHLHRLLRSRPRPGLRRRHHHRRKRVRWSKAPRSPETSPRSAAMPASKAAPRWRET